MKFSDLSRSQKAELLALTNLGYSSLIQQAKREERKNVDAFVSLAHHKAYRELRDSGLDDGDAELKLSNEWLDWNAKLIQDESQFDGQLKGILK